jgi:hypothetical protein
MEKFTFSQGRNQCWHPKPMIIAFLLMCSLFGYAQTNGSLACNDLVQVSLDGDCRAEINPDMILEGTYPNWTDFTVKISNVVGSVVTKPGFHTVTVTNVITGNNCWGNITVEDKLAPVVVNCPCEKDNEDEDCQFSCAQLDGIKAGTVTIPVPVVDENCSVYTTKITDSVKDNGCQGKVFTRTYVYTDVYGNVSKPCVSYFYLAPVKLADITPPAKNVQLTCGAKTEPQDIYNFLKPSLGATVARTYAWPTLDGAIVSEDGPCNLAAAKTDAEILACGPLCTDSKKIIRTWTVLDWCANQSVSYVQIIKATDNKAPVVVAPDLTVSVDPWGCNANITFPEPTVLKDDCSSAVTYTVEGPAGVQMVYQTTLKRWLAINAPKGLHKFFYKASDCCGNVGVDTVMVSVKDLSSPVAISKEFVVVSLTSGGNGKGIAKVYAPSIDNGSHDGCTDIKLEIRRDTDNCNVQGNDTYNADGHSFDGSSDPNSPNYDPDNGAYVKFCCADLTGIENGVPFGKVKVWLRVWDDGDMDGYFGSAGDNYNETWSYVRVEDKLAPTLVCPKDITLECDQDYKDLNLTGKAQAAFTCAFGEVEYTDSPSLNSCGTGTVRRKWSVKGYPSVSCTQVIVIKPTPVGGVVVTFPKDITTDCKNLPNVQKPTYSGGPCNLLGFAVQSDTFYIEDGVCMKILNKFTVIDWCTYEPNNPNSLGIWRGTQVIKIKDDKAPVITCQNQMFEVNDNTDADNDGNKCELKGLVLTNTADDNGDCASKWLKWIVTVDLLGDGSSDYEYTSFINPSDVSFGTDSNLNGIPDKYLSPSSSGDAVSITIPVDITGSMSNHKIQWRVTDGCGNFTSCSNTFMVVDKKKPTPYCISLSTALMVNGTVELWARDFDKGSFDNCTKSENLLFTFDNANPVLSKIAVEHYFKGAGVEATKAEFDAGDAQRWVPTSKSSSKIFNCDDLPEASVEMTVWDEKLNFDFCTVKLTLVDNQGACGGLASAAISGQLKLYEQGIFNAKINLSGASQTISKEIFTDNTGAYKFPFNPMNVNYEISAVKNDDPLNGVSTIDLVLMQRHILGMTKFNNAEHIIAADVNGDQKISASDLVELRKVILGVLPNFTNNNSWRFIDASSTFANVNSPWPLDETIRISNLDHEMLNQNFKGIKIGDVNKNATANLKSIGSSNRTNNNVNLVVEEQDLVADQVYAIKLNLKDFNLKAYQFALETEGADIVGFEFDNVEGKDFYNLKNKNQALVSWNTNDAYSFANNIIINIKATKNGKLSDVLAINERMLASAAYVGEELEENALQVVFRQLAKDIQQEFVVYQNQPNPFKDATNISFFLPQAQEATLKIFDVTGKSLHLETKSFAKGLNTFNVNMTNLGNGGVMYYQIESGDYNATKIMIGLK